MLPNANGAAVTLFGADVGRPRAGDDQLHRRRRQRPRRLQGGARSTPSSPRAPSSRRASSTRWSTRSRRASSIVYLEDVRADHQRLPTSCAGCSHAEQPLVARKADDPAVDPVHLGLGGHAEGRRAVPPQHAGQCRAGRGAHRLRPQDKVFNVLPVFHSFGLTVGIDAAAGLRRARSISIRRRCTTASCRSWSTASNATIMFGTDTFLNGYARAAHPYDFRSLRYILAGAEPVQGIDAAHLYGKVRPAHPRRLWRDRDRAGARAQHADVQQVRHGRPAAARHGGAARAGAGHRRGRPAVRARART